MDYLKILHENPDLAEEFDSLFDFFLLDELSPRDDAEGRCTFSMPGMAFARDGSGGEYHLLEDGSIGYYSSRASRYSSQSGKRERPCSRPDGLPHLRCCNIQRQS